MRRGQGKPDLIGLQEYLTVPFSWRSVRPLQRTLSWVAGTDAEPTVPAESVVSSAPTRYIFAEGGAVRTFSLSFFLLLEGRRRRGGVAWAGHGRCVSKHQAAMPSPIQDSGTPGFPVLAELLKNSRRNSKVRTLARVNTESFFSLALVLQARALRSGYCNTRTGLRCWCRPPADPLIRC